MILSLDAQGIATMNFDQTSLPQMDDLLLVLDEAINDDNVKGFLLLASGSNFIADEKNADEGDVAKLFARMLERHRVLRRLETCGKPVAIALSGGAAGVSLELAVVAHYRVASDVVTAQFGISPNSSGRMPGSGGTQRLPRLVGIQNALSMLLDNKKISAAEALAQQLVHALAPAGSESNEARLWLLSRLVQTSAVQQSWDVKGYKVPGGAVSSPAIQQLLMISNAMLRARSHAHNHVLDRASVNTLSSVYEGLITDIDTGLKTEARYFVNTIR
ncbi:enoyl-CoA hydratase/isomerase family protein [Undibacterium sp. RuTC16W]